MKKTVKILVIDDEPLIRRAFQKLFTAPFYEVSVAEDGAQGLEIWKSRNFNFVFLDVIMPGLNGWEVLEEKGSWTGTRVQLMSAYTGDLSDKKVWIEKVDGFLQKPFDNVMTIKNWVESFKE